MAKQRSDEDFLVGSILIRKDLRKKVAEFYQFARKADDVADDPCLSSEEKLKILDEMEGDAPSLHAKELLIAFRMDAKGYEYNSFSDLMDYCRYSACPVGQFMLDIHNEPALLSHPSRALCSVLQILNHIQDREKDLKNLNRVYIKEENLNEYIENTKLLMKEAINIRKIYDFRLRLEISIIFELASLHLKKIEKGKRLSKIDWAKACFFGILKGIKRK